jgi:hypothetical protein
MRHSTSLGSTAQRGYGGDHQKRRAEWAPQVALGGIQCFRCGVLIAPEFCPCPKCRKPTRKGGEAGRGFCGWDLGHNDQDRTLPTFPEHACCNRATKKHGRQHRKPTKGKQVSREW